MAEQRDRILQTLVDAVEEIGADLDGPTIPWTLLAVVSRLVPTHEIGFMDMDYRRHRFVTHQVLSDGARVYLDDMDTAGEPWWKLTANSTQPVNPRFSTVGLVDRWTARLSGREIRSWPLHQEYWKGIGDLIMVEFPAPAGHTRRLLLWRLRPERFTEREEIIVRLLRPHLFEIDRRARRHQEGAAVLTSREWQVLELAADGASNAEIAATLVTSVATVRKHMEHIFDRSGVRTRSAAVAKLIPIRGDAEDLGPLRL